MAERELQNLVKSLKTAVATGHLSQAPPLLSKAKLLLLQLNALTPTPSTPPALLALARDVYEQGALASIRAKDAPAFTRYVAQLRPFYELQRWAPNSNGNNNAAAGERNKITALYLLLLLTQGSYGEFHSELEALAASSGDGGLEKVESDRYLGYPIKLERWLMEGSYDRVWKAMKKGEVPCEEFGMFSEILTSQIRSEIASSSERAYPSLPLASTKSLLFLDSEGAVVDFARARGWIVKDGTIYFPSSSSTSGGATGLGLVGEEGLLDPAATSGGFGADKEGEKELSLQVIENTLRYARQLETIV
ncbi:hypothetical protein VTJ04DRAFT_10768 [Mycothermus thermophilus]|uniref:uncharacterized protein n=1 Tax=Humicola insolens TaxID=85995 RepID=UPI0037449A4C